MTDLHTDLVFMQMSDITIICSCGSAGTDQMKEIVFPPSSSPSFLTVPGEGFAEPFALNPGNWIIHIKAEGVLLVSFKKTLFLTCSCGIL